jgi:hypothetical protein
MPSNAARQKWWSQVETAATKSGKIPVLWVRYDREDWQVVMDLSDILQVFWGKCDDFNDLKGQLATITPEAFYVIACEHSYPNFFQDPNRPSVACHACGGSGSITTELNDPMGWPYSVDVEETCNQCKGAGEWQPPYRKGVH